MANFIASLNYRSDLFLEQASMRRMLGHFENLLNAALQNPDARIAELPMMSAEERQQLLVEWNRTSAEYPRDLTIPEAFENQTQRTPDATALLFEGRSWTYPRDQREREPLGTYSGQKGIGQGSLVGDILDRSPESGGCINGSAEGGSGLRAFGSGASSRSHQSPAAGCGIIQRSDFFWYQGPLAERGPPGCDSRSR